MDSGGITRVENERLNQTVEAGIEKPYAYHRPSDDGLSKITQVRRAFSELDRLLKATCPASRELSVAITNLETTAMWAIKAVVINDSASVVEQPN
jgi:hypothetical protein